MEGVKEVGDGGGHRTGRSAEDCSLEVLVDHRVYVAGNVHPLADGDFPVRIGNGRAGRLFHLVKIRSLKAETLASATIQYASSPDCSAVVKHHSFLWFIQTWQIMLMFTHDPVLNSKRSIILGSLWIETICRS